MTFVYVVFLINEIQRCSYFSVPDPSVINILIKYPYSYDIIYLVFFLFISNIMLQYCLCVSNLHDPSNKIVALYSVEEIEFYDVRNVFRKCCFHLLNINTSIEFSYK